jgi:hypothetical protein
MPPFKFLRRVFSLKTLELKLIYTKRYSVIQIFIAKCFDEFKNAHLKVSIKELSILERF